MHRLAPGCMAFCLMFLLCGGTGWQQAVVQAQGQSKPIVWRLQTSWPASNLIQLSVQELAKMIDEMSGGRLKWEVMPAGTVVGAFEVLDAVHRGVIDATHAWPGYWTGKHPAAGLYGPPPVGPSGWAGRSS